MIIVLTAIFHTVQAQQNATALALFEPCQILRSTNPFWINFFLAALSTIIAQTLTAPIERVKIYVQTTGPTDDRRLSYGQALTALGTRSSGNFSGIKSLTKLWKGNTAALITSLKFDDV